MWLIRIWKKHFFVRLNLFLGLLYIQRLYILLSKLLMLVSTDDSEGYLLRPSRYL